MRHTFTVLKSAALAATLLCSAAMPAQADSLQDALVSAYQNHPQLMAERARVREIDENYVQAQAQGRFTASGTASAGITNSIIRTRGQASFFNANPADVTTKDTFVPRSFAVTGQKPLYQGGRIRSLMGQAKYGILAAREGLRNAEQSILLTAASSYADVLRDEQVAAIRRNNVRVLARQGDAARDRFDVGAGTRTDIAQADARLAAAETGLAAADAQLAASRASYERATGHIANQLEPIPEFVLPATMVQAQEMALTYNPQLESARYSQDAAKFGIDVAKSNGRPRISLQTFTQVQTDQGGAVLGQEAIGLSANLTIPIITGGLNASQVRQARAAENRAVFETRNVENAVKERVAALWAQREGAKRSLEASRLQVRAAEIAFEGVEIEQQVGTRTALDVLDAEQEVLNARLSVAQAQNNVDVITFQLLVIVGAFDALSLQLPVEHYNPRDNFEDVSSYSVFDPLTQAVEDLPPPARKVADSIGEVGTAIKSGQPIEDLKQIPEHLKRIPGGLKRILIGDTPPKTTPVPVDPDSIEPELITGSN